MDDVTIVGAGVIGLACAVEFQRRGYQVTLVDPAEPGRACSFGNAGVIATSEVFPIISPAHIRGLPRMLLSRDAPVAIRPGAFPELAGWLWRAARSLGEERQSVIVASLSALNRLALPAWRDLLADCDASALLAERGMIRLIRDDRARPALRQRCDALNMLSVRAEMLSADDVLDLEPGLDRTVVGGLLHSSDAHVRSPLEVSRALLDRVLGAGGALLTDRVLAIAPADGGVDVVTGSGARRVGKLLVTAGLQSGTLLEPLGLRVPLQAERGYHLMLDGGGGGLSRPLTLQAESCAATPMGDGLRLAGTVEFAKDTSPPTWFRAERLAPIAQRYFAEPLPVSGATRWVGSRPSLPDSLPAIGTLPACGAIGYAFGHQHLGLTQAAISAKLLAGRMHHEASAVDLQPLALERFGSEK
jgi:D-amino-acid dehydrogenase